MSEATAIIRRAIHDGPSRDEFLRIARAFDRLRPEEVAGMLSFAAKHVEHWSPEMRVAPPSWWHRAARGEDVPGFRFVRTLELFAPGGGPELARAIADSPATRQFLRLAIESEPIGDEGAAHLARTDRLVQLETLALIDASIGPVGARALMQANLRALATLDLSGNPLPPEALEPLLRALEPGALAVARCGLGAEGARRLAATDRSERLSSLDLSGNDAGDAGAGAISASGWFGHLSELSLAADGITARGARALAQTRWLSNLTSLDLSDNAIGDEGFALIAPRLGSLAELRIANVGLRSGLDALLARASLTVLDASGNRLGPDLLPRLAAIRELALRDSALDPSAVGRLAHSRGSLDLAGNPLTLAAVAVLAQCSFDHLDLSRTDLGDAGLALIARSPTLSSLRSLRLANDGITPDGLSALLSSERTIRLASIDLSDNPLGPEGARRLADSDLLARLTRIHARNCGFTGEWIETLLSKNENCRC